MHASVIGRNSDLPTRRSDQPPHYTPAPHHLITNLQDSPLAIGLYTLIARRYFIAQAAIPLSAADVQRYDPTISRGAFLRAVARLTDGGWLVEERCAGGKTRYTPTWGIVKGRNCPWQLGAPALGRPNHVTIVRVDQRLFDICLGRLETLSRSPAVITRYLTRPLLGLADIGAYALTLRGIPNVTPALERLGLIVAGAAQPLLGTDHLLALASQGALGDGNVALTAEGVRLLGMTPIPPAEKANHEQPLFFVPPQMIGR